jgi:Flp pilus assembly protein TadD
MDRSIKTRKSAPLIGLVVSTALASVAFAGFTASAAPRVDRSVAKAEAALKSGHSVKAVTYAEAAVLADPRNADVRALLGAAYLSAGRFQAAATSFEDALELGNEDPRTVLSYALAKIALGDRAAAVETLNEWEDVLNAADYGLALALAGQPERGVHVLTNEVRFGEVTPKLRQNLAYAYALSGNWRAARVMAAEDVPAGKIDERLAEWAAMAAPEDQQRRVASLLKVTPVADMGQPAQLALANFPERAVMFAAADPVEEVAAPSASERPSQSEALAFGIADPVVAQPIERVDPASAPARVAGAPVASPAPTAPGVRFVSNPVVQQLQQREARPVAAPAAPRAASAPAPQRRMAATAAASDEGAGTHLVQLGSYNSKVEAERGWNVLKSRFPQLKDHDVVITEAVVNGRTFWRVAAAGFGAMSARNMCSSVKSAGRGCFAYAASSPPAGAVDKGVRMAARTR